jgi:hypothetical protein
MAGVAWGYQQSVDPSFMTTVEAPAFPKGGPTVAIDEAHQNFHTASGGYSPLARLLQQDGHRVIAFDKRFGGSTMSGIGVLVIANARGSDPKSSAFTDEECEAVDAWVRRGGSLLLIADHAPFGFFAEKLAWKFGVRMGQGWVFQPSGSTITTQLVFSRDNGLLGQHAILRGRNAAEEVKTLKSFTGQSLSVPGGATVLMKLGTDAREAPNTAVLNAEAAARKQGAATKESTPVGERAQGLAMTVGKGRVVILGEAAMLSAQVVTIGGQTIKAGMNAPGNNNRQFALNLFRWLARVL